MGAEENYAGLFSGNLDEDVFHRQSADGRVGCETVGFNRAPVAFQFRLQKILQSRECRRPRRPWAKLDLLGDQRIGALAIEAIGFVGRRRVIGRLRRSRSRLAHEGRLTLRAGIRAASLAARNASGKETQE